MCIQKYLRHIVYLKDLRAERETRIILVRAHEGHTAEREMALGSDLS